jgi:hypothetical protein
MNSFTVVSMNHEKPSFTNYASSSVAFLPNNNNIIGYLWLP